MRRWHIITSIGRRLRPIWLRSKPPRPTGSNSSGPKQLGNEPDPALSRRLATSQGCQLRGLDVALVGQVIVFRGLPAGPCRTGDKNRSPPPRGGTRPTIEIVTGLVEIALRSRRIQPRNRRRRSDLSLNARCGATPTQ